MKEKHRIDFILVVYFISLGLLFSIEQYFRCGSFFQIKDLNHETFIVASLFGAFTILISWITKLISKGGEK